jgi:phospholipid/cholesterol/gamma-HCH transport system substrate-binding protein
MDRDRRLSLIVGGFVLLALGTLALAILSLSAQRGLWTSRYRLIAYFGNVQGLIGGAPVWLAGTQVGRVESLSLGTRPTGEPAVRVQLQVDREVEERIRADSVAQIGTIGLLGDKYVELTMGTDAAAALRDGDELGTVSPIDVNMVMSTGAQALESVERLATNMNEVIEGFGTEGTQNLAAAFSAMTDMIQEVRSGEGLLHSLIYDEYEGGSVESVEKSLATLEKILREIDQGDGVLHSLIYDAPTEQDVVLEVLEAGARLNSILAKVDRGDGTLGLMVNDPTLYEDLKLLVGGANRSAVVRTMIRMSTDDE